MVEEKVTISKLPYRNLTKVIDLITFERTILSLFTNDKNEYFLLYLYDVLSEYDEYFFWKVNLLDLYSFLYKRVSLKELILIDTKEFVFIIYSDYHIIEDFSDSDSYLRVEQILLGDILDDCLPKSDSFWAYSIPKPLISVLEKFSRENYLETLRENSIYFIVEPSDSRFLNTVSTLDITGFLTNLTSSYLAFVEYDFSEKFSGIFNDTESYDNSVTLLKSTMLPRVSDTKFGSFEVGLSVDFQYPLIQENDEMVAWQKTAIDVYKEKVLDLNYESPVEINEILESYPLNVRQRIFNPIYNISTNPRYTVKSTNRLKTKFENLPVIAKETKKIITQNDNDELFELEHEIQRELTNVILSLPKGGSIGDLNKRAFLKSILAVTKSEISESKYSEPFDYRTKHFNFITPLPISIAVRGLANVLFCDILGIEVNSTDNHELYRNFHKEIYEYYVTRVMNNPRSPEAKMFYIYIDVSDIAEL
ncbi:hypothetical protein IC229_09005 [Spirosoma sp. BT702]|uniref:Uncharacterized protein n=1 Tax=Spirosoma profusum TaxID=2771354 RepID=A0A926XUL5_9BACT|nr:hypothetical protein [Spirosoma profusum]MBD2700774.1 hypothetical protein [Spirosoma profusum]